MRATDRQATMEGALQQNGWNSSHRGTHVQRSSAMRPSNQRAEWHEHAGAPYHSFGWADLSGSLRRAGRAVVPDLDRTLRSGALIGGAMQSLSCKNIELAGRVLQKQFVAELKLVNSRTPEEFLVAQQDLLRTTVTEFNYWIRTMAEAISNIVE